MVKAPNLCVICKGGKYLCGNKPCPLLARLNIAPKIAGDLDETFFGPSTSVFVGHIGYPKVNFGPIGLLGENKIIEDPSKWFGLSYEKIIEMRSLVVRAKKLKNVKYFDRMVEESQLIVASKKPVDVEIFFKEKPKYKFSFSDITQPIGASGKVSFMKVVGNPKISHRVEYILNDELKATDQITLLHKKLDIYKITNIFSSGALGVDKKIVPTRWSITTVDDILAKEMMKRIREYREVEKFYVYESEYLHNHFVILLMPGKWEFENFEAWAPGSTWARGVKEVQILEEYEPFYGRTKYAELEGGGYYASRFSVCEYLDKIKRQAKVVVFREISEGYVIPVGVWEVRENVRNAFRNKPTIFSNLTEALNHVSLKLRIPISEYKKKSKILVQKRIFEF